MEDTGNRQGIQAASALAALQAWMEAGLVGRGPMVERLLTALLAGGHVLIEGAPGLAKTRAVKRLAEGLEGSFSRIQCTPDLMPADLTGTPAWRPDRGSFEFVPGPVFHGLVLVDEINRAPPKVQSALLEAMAEAQVTVAGMTYPLPDPFMVVATQNPIEHEGTFPLPEAQLDRFLLHVVLDLPDARTERAILDLVEAEGAEAARPPPPCGTALLRTARQAAMAVYLAPAIRDYIVRLVMATRQDPAPDSLSGAIEHAVSPRGSLSLAAAAKAQAWLRGRDHVVPGDVAELACDVLAHRLVLTWRATADGITPREVISRIAERVAVL